MDSKITEWILCLFVCLNKVVFPLAEKIFKTYLKSIDKQLFCDV